MRIKDWQKFQHYKERTPAWIKLYRDLLDDIEWFKLDGDTAKVLVMMWLIASENEGNLPANEELAFRLRLPEHKLKQIVSKLHHWLEQDASTPLAGCYQDACLEREIEEEKEKEVEKDIIPLKPQKFGEFGNVLLSAEEQLRLIDKFGNDDALARIERLSAYLASSGKRYKSHYATILNWSAKDVAAPARRRTYADDREERGREQMRQFVEGL